MFLSQRGVLREEYEARLENALLVRNIVVVQTFVLVLYPNNGTLLWLRLDH